MLFLSSYSFLTSVLSSTGVACAGVATAIGAEPEAGAGALAGAGVPMIGEPVAALIWAQVAQHMGVHIQL